PSSTLSSHALSSPFCAPLSLLSILLCPLSFFFLYCSADPRDLHSFPTRRSSDLELDLDGEEGVVRAVPHAHTKDGGLAVLKGNLARDGAVFKTAGVTEDLFHFEGTAVVCDSQEEAVQKILDKTVKAGDVVVIRYEGPQGGPGMQEMLYPTSFLKGRGLGKTCALI